MKTMIDLSHCIVWTGATTAGGYGVQRNPETRKVERVHRRAWEQAHGPIPDGLLVCHRCDNPPCYNVEHLFLGTKVDNAADMVAKGRQQFYFANHAKLIHADVRAIRANSEPVRLVAQRYNVSRSTIYRVKQREIFKDVL